MAKQLGKAPGATTSPFSSTSAELICGELNCASRSPAEPSSPTERDLFSAKPIRCRLRLGGTLAAPGGSQGPCWRPPPATPPPRVAEKPPFPRHRKKGTSISSSSGVGGESAGRERGGNKPRGCPGWVGLKGWPRGSNGAPQLPDVAADGQTPLGSTHGTASSIPSPVLPALTLHCPRTRSRSLAAHQARSAFRRDFGFQPLPPGDRGARR